MKLGNAPETPERIACILCGSNRRKFVFEENGYDLLRCLNCGLFYVNPMPSYGQNLTEHTSVALPTAERHYAIEKSFFDQWYPQIRPELAQAHAVLDVGCGCGRLLELIREDFPNKVIAGIELDRDRAEYARGKAKCAVYTEPLEKLDLPPNFDAITMINVLSHIPNIKQFLAYLREWMPDEGRIVVKTGECADNVRRIDGGNKWYLPDHVHFLGLGTIDYICNTMGYKKIVHQRVPYSKLLFERQSLRQMSGNWKTDWIRRLLIGMPPLRWAGATVYRVLFNRVYTSFIVLEKSVSSDSE